MKSSSFHADDNRIESPSSAGFHRQEARVELFNPGAQKEQREDRSIAIMICTAFIPGGNRQAVDRLDEPVMPRRDGGIRNARVTAKAT